MTIYEILEASGWHNEDDQMYPPHGTFRLSGNADLMPFRVGKMHENVTKLLQEMSENPPAHLSKIRIQHHTDDLKSFVNITQKIIGEK